MALASANLGELQVKTINLKPQLNMFMCLFSCNNNSLLNKIKRFQVRVNDQNTKRPLFSSGLIGRDNAVVRHGIHGLYWLFNVEIPNAVLVKGENTIYLTQARGQSPWQYLMYDYIRLEGAVHTATT